MPHIKFSSKVDNYGIQSTYALKLYDSPLAEHVL